jgi:hypothetical protein
MEASVGYWPVKEDKVFALQSQQTHQMRQSYIYRPQTQPAKHTTFVSVPKDTIFIDRFYPRHVSRTLDVATQRSVTEANFFFPSASPFVLSCSYIRPISLS